MKPRWSSRAARRLVARCSQPVRRPNYKKPDKSNLKFYLVCCDKSDRCVNYVCVQIALENVIVVAEGSIGIGLLIGSIRIRLG